MIPRLHVRGVGPEGGEVGVGVEGEAGEGDLQLLPFFRLDDDVRDLPALLVRHYLDDASELRSVSRPRLEPDKTSLLQVVLQISLLLIQIYPVPDGLYRSRHADRRGCREQEAPSPTPYSRRIPWDSPSLRQLRQDLGHPVEVGVERLSFAHHIREGYTIYPRPPERDHHAGLPVGQGPDRGRAEPARQDPVRSRGDAAALDVADDREARVVGAFGPEQMDVN